MELSIIGNMKFDDSKKSRQPSALSHHGQPLVRTRDEWRYGAPSPVQLICNKKLSALEADG
jgi:hypothetical protein